MHRTHPERTITALIVLMVGIGAIWFYLPRYTSVLGGLHFSPVTYVPQGSLALHYATSTSAVVYRGSLLIEGCNTIITRMLPVGTTTLYYTLALSVERPESCVSVGVVPQAFSASMPLTVRPVFVGVTVNGAIVPYTLTQDK